MSIEIHSDVKYTYPNPTRHIFSAGEVNVSLHDFINGCCATPDHLYIIARIRSSDDLMELIIVTHALRCQYPRTTLSLTLPYLPYSRQDRVCNVGEALGVRVFADMINALKFTKVVTYDAHSSVGLACINNCINVEPEYIVEQAHELASDLRRNLYTLIAPDAGAVKKVEAVGRFFGGLDVIVASKVRDTKTGRITGTKINHKADFRAVDLLIVDDICDGGMTFIKLAEKLNSWYQPKSISLYVTHGIFSKGKGVLFDAGISTIYTTDSFPNDTIGLEGKLHVIKI